VIRAVIDTNILVSAMIAPSGNEALVILAVQHGLIQACFSEDILQEYAGVLARPRFGFPDNEIKALLYALQNHGDLLDPPALAGISPDPGDDKFLACALAAKADFLITGNKRDFPEDPIKPTKVVSAGELLDLITLEL
jgi:uncharacterized protein